MLKILNLKNVYNFKLRNKKNLQFRMFQKILISKMLKILNLKSLENFEFRKFLIPKILNVENF